MSKKATDFYGDLQALAKKESQSKKPGDDLPKAFGDQYRKKLNSRPIPWFKISILMSLISSVAYYKHEELMQSKFYVENIKPIPVVQKVEETLKVQDPVSVRPESRGSDADRNAASSYSTSTKYNPPAQGGAESSSTEKSGEQKKPRMVQIRGKYYPESPDNIYIINGEKVFYKGK